MAANFAINGATCRSARAVLGWSAETLADRAGVSRTTVWRVEKDPAQIQRGPVALALLVAFNTAGIDFLTPGEVVPERVIAAIAERQVGGKNW